jgi:HD domain
VTAAASNSEPVRSATLDPTVELALAQTRVRRWQQLGGSNLLSAIAIGGAFLLAAALVFAYLPPDRPTVPWLVAFFVLSLAIAARVEFAIGWGYAIPSELVFVPMLFVLPLRIVPLCVAAAMVLRNAPEFARGRLTLDRAFLRLVSSWYAIGPVLVLGLAGSKPPAMRYLPLYALALASQFLFDFGSTALRERFALGISVRKLVGFICWAWVVDFALAPVGLGIAIAATEQQAAVVLALPLVALLAFFARERKQRQENLIELSQAYRGTALLLGDVVEADDEYTGLHSRDVVQLVLDVCDELGLSAKDRRDAEFTALLHDVGKIKIPAEVINKPGPLTDEERAIINTHTIEGERLLSQIGGLLGQVGTFVRSCHERWDGKGYPDGLAGEAIPRIARIVCVCDAYSAITTNRPYREARPVAAALEELRACAGAQFDPEVVAALERVLA